MTSYYTAFGSFGCLVPGAQSVLASLVFLKVFF